MRQGLHTSAVGYMVTYIIAISCAAVMAVPDSAFAQYPEKPVKFMVQWAPSDREDVLIRMILKTLKISTVLALLLSSNLKVRSPRLAILL